MILSLISNQRQSINSKKNFSRIDTPYQYIQYLIHQFSFPGLFNQIKANFPRTWFALLSAVMLLLLAVACDTAATPDPVTSTPAESNKATQTPAVSKINVQTTTTVLADMVRAIGGDMVEADSIVPAGADIHIYQVSPSQSVAISKAKLIISNGAGLDDFLNPALANANSAAVRVVASRGLTPEVLEEMSLSVNGNNTGDGDHGEELSEEVKHLIHEVEEGAISPEDAVQQMEELLGGHEGSEEEHHEDSNSHDEEGLEEELIKIIHEVEDGHLTAESAIESIEQVIEQHHGDEGHKETGHLHGHDSGDPHFWLDPILAIHYVEQISEGLKQVDPENAQVYSANTAQYTQELRDLDQEITKELSQVPPEHRHLITFHDAYGYLARRYGWEISAFVPGHGGDVTPQAIVQVMNKIQADGIPAVFREPQFAEDVLRETAQTTGVAVGVIRSLVDDTESTYLTMMRSNARSMVENLK